MENVYKGLCACEGTVKGKITKSLEEEGILLIDTLKPSEFLNPGKTKGVIMRRGGILSHGAIVSREYGIPCIVSADVPELENNVIVELNATKGRVKVIK